MFARPHLLATFFGDAWTALEEWQFTLRLDSTELPNPTQLAALLAAYEAFHTSADTLITVNARYLGVKVAQQDVNGLYPPDSQAVELFRASPLVGGATAGNTYPQVTVAVSLRTSILRGRGANGRFYPPPMARAVQTDGRLSAANATLYATQGANFVDRVNDVGIGPVSVFSNPEIGVGPANPVINVRVGRVVDTQRRRRNQLQEEHVEVPVPLA